jgi:hypothetical protein
MTHHPRINNPQSQFIFQVRQLRQIRHPLPTIAEKTRREINQQFIDQAFAQQRAVEFVAGFDVDKNCCGRI